MGCYFLLTVLIVIFSPSVLPAAVTGSFQCHENSDCSTDQCCSKIPRFLAVSKRQLAPPLDFYVSASCKSYLQLNQTCANVMKVNGDCGCAPHLTCHYFPELDTFNHLFVPPEPVQISKDHPAKRDMFPGNPNAFKCIPKST